MDELTDAGWMRFQEYAARVQSIHLADISKVHTTAWFILTHRCGQTALIPRLEQMTGLTIDLNTLCYTMLFSPTIRHLEIKIDQSIDDGALRMITQAIHPTLSAVRLLAIDDRGRYNAAHAGMPFWTFTQLNTLEVAHDATVSLPQIRALAEFPTLHTLSLRLKTIVDSSADSIPTKQQSGFPSLRTLSLAGNLGDISLFFTSATPPSLETLDIEAGTLCGTDRDENGLSAQDFYRRARSLRPVYAALTSSLRHFNATLCCDCQSGSHFPDSGELIEPLCAARGLQTISFVF